MSSSSSALRQPVYGELLLNVGDLIEQALARKQEINKKEFQSFNPSTDNFPFLLKQSGVRDIGRYAVRWSPKGDFNRHGGYSRFSNYQLRSLEGYEPLSTPQALWQISVRRNMYATTRELLGVLISHRSELCKLLRQKHRLVAIGSDMFHYGGAAILTLTRREIFLSEVLCDGLTTWLPSDLFLTRIEDPL